MEVVIVTNQMVLDAAPEIARTCSYTQDVRQYPSSPVIGLRIAETEQVLSALGLRWPTPEEGHAANITAKRCDGMTLSDFRVWKKDGFACRFYNEELHESHEWHGNTGRLSATKTQPFSNGRWSDKYGGDCQHSDVLVVGIKD